MIGAWVIETASIMFYCSNIAIMLAVLINVLSGGGMRWDWWGEGFVHLIIATLLDFVGGSA